MTLRTRLAAALGIVLLVLGVMSIVLPHIVRSALQQQVDEQLKRAIPIGERVADVTLPLPGLDPDGDRPSDAAPTFDMYVARVAADGTQTEVSDGTDRDDMPDLPSEPTASGGDVHIATVGAQVGEGSWRAVLVVTSRGDQVVLAMPLDSVNGTIRRINTALFVAIIAALVVVVAAGWWVFRLGLRPIREVTSVAAAYSTGERARRVAEPAPRTEAGQLARAFNEMLDEQQTAEDRLRRFVADASHELRNPVAAIGGFADLYRHGGIEPADLDDVMRRVGQESARMRDLVEDMLLLARLDESRPLDRRPVDIARLVADAVLDASARHPSRRVSVTGPPNLVVAGDDARLRQVVSNLLANALIHTDGDVAVRVGDAGDHVTVVVTDHGPGMAPEVLHRLFDRFWRGDDARSGTGTGLGMPIVRGIVEAHRGRVEVTSALDAGTIVTVSLPKP